MSYAARIARTVTVVALCAGTVLWAGPRKPPTAKEQVEFGVKMASRGLWSEALFRFRQADRLDPGNPDILNNLAVAHEALGMFEEALESYRKALEVAPSDKGIRRNYSRFVEFYQSFKPPEESQDEGEETEATSSGDRT